MKNILKIVVVTAIIFFLLIISVKFDLSKNYSFEIKDKNIHSKVLYKGLKNATDFTADNNENYFVAFNNKIQCINKNGFSYTIFKNNNYSIYSIEYYENKLYFSANNSIYCLDLKNKKVISIMNNLPNFGDYKKVIIKIANGYLYASIGSATNSGVVGLDNKWINIFPFGHDITPKTITLRGEKFGDNNTGAFCPYGTKNYYGQIISEHFPGNSSIIIYNLKTGMAETFAYGIRNTVGMDFNSDGNIVAAVGGMEDRGLRPVKGDKDSIYIIDKNKWYGFPDYSGGMPILTFKGMYNRSINNLLDKHPTTLVPQPIFRNNPAGSIGIIAVDCKGVLKDKDNIYYYDKKNNDLCYIDNNRTTKVVLKVPVGQNISSIKFINDKLAVLNDKDGYILEFSRNIENSSEGFTRLDLYSFIIIIVISIGTTITILMKGRGEK